MSYSNYTNYSPMYQRYSYPPPGNSSFRPDLNAALNLDPLASHVYGGFQPQQTIPGGNNNPYINSYNPIAPNYIGDSPLGFAQNVLDPMMAPVTATYRQTAAMIDDAVKNKK